jgi:hypothetical protein
MLDTYHPYGCHSKGRAIMDGLLVHDILTLLNSFQSKHYNDVQALLDVACDL